MVDVYANLEKFQSRKQDYFNWKINYSSLGELNHEFQSRKQDYFNWKAGVAGVAGVKLCDVSVPQAGLF